MVLGSSRYIEIIHIETVKSKTFPLRTKELGDTTRVLTNLDEMDLVLEISLLSFNGYRHWQEITKCVRRATKCPVNRVKIVGWIALLSPTCSNGAGSRVGKQNGGNNSRRVSDRKKWKETARSPMNNARDDSRNESGRSLTIFWDERSKVTGGKDFY